ncbi:F-box protein CPR1-like [Silene latifolia]|uniref:F-box protein CPR1-like n=1 Tax=Silene latifolia TaxID=37657 RepID=UPI003D7878F2
MASFSEANHRLLILPSKEDSFRIYELDSPHSSPTLCPYPIPSKQFETSSISVVACCESYLLIGYGFTELEGLILFNPTTRIYRALPKVYVAIDADYVHYGMCHCLDDEFNDDFKIVRLVQYDREHKVREVMVYSLSTNSWKSIELKQTRSQWIGYPVLIQNHLLVMIFYDGYLYGRFTRIGCFDIKAERWSNDVLLSDILLGEIDFNFTQPYQGVLYHLGVLERQLRFSCYDMNKLSYSIWVMKEYGVKESWVKLMSVSGKSLVDVRHPIAYRQGSSNQLLCIPKYSWFNLRDKQFIEMGFDGEGLNSYRYSFAYVCKASLLNFPGGKPIHSSSKKPDDDDNEDEEEANIFLRLSQNSI